MPSKSSQLPSKFTELSAVHQENHGDSTSQTAKRPERRKRVRARLHWQVHLQAVDRMQAIESTTRDISSNGFYCSSPVPFVQGERTVCVVKVPAYSPGWEGLMLSLECKVRITRVEPGEDNGSYGLGCEIEDYRFLHI